MSNDPIRVTFPDGTQMFTMGDAWSARSPVLYPTQAEAQAAYDEGYVNENARLFDEMAAETDSEQVTVETTYGSLDRSWIPMLTTWCLASKKHRCITYGPAYDSPDPEEPWA